MRPAPWCWSSSHRAPITLTALSCDPPTPHTPHTPHTPLTHLTPTSYPSHPARQGVGAVQPVGGAHRAGVLRAGRPGTGGRHPRHTHLRPPEPHPAGQAPGAVLLCCCAACCATRCAMPLLRPCDAACLALTHGPPLPPAPGHDAQTGFTKGVVQPLYTALGAIPGVEIGVCLAQIEANLDAWAREQEGALVPPPMTDARAPAGSDGVHTPTPQPATPDSTHSPAPLSPRTPTSSRSPAALAVGGVARQHRGFASVSGGADRAAAPAAAVDSPIPEDDIDALIAALGTEVTEGGSASGPGSAVGGASSHSSGTGRGRYNSHGGGRSSPPGLVLDSAASSLPSGPASTRSGLAVSPLGRRSASGHSGGARDGDSTRAAAGASPGGARTRFSPSGSPQRRESGSATRESQRSGGAPTPGIGLPAGASAGAGGAGGGASGGGAGRRRSSVASNFALLSPEMWQELEGDLSPSRQAWGSALRPRTSSSTNGHGRPPPSR